MWSGFRNETSYRKTPPTLSLRVTTNNVRSSCTCHSGQKDVMPVASGLQDGWRQVNNLGIYVVGTGFNPVGLLDV